MGSGLTTTQLARLDAACQVVYAGFGTVPYLVGSAGDSLDWRDVDVRLIMRDDEFDRLFGDRRARWEIVCMAISTYLSDATGLPVDFQIQRMTEANEKHRGPRNPLGLHGTRFAGGGDATRFTEGTA